MHALDDGLKLFGGDPIIPMKGRAVDHGLVSISGMHTTTSDHGLFLWTILPQLDLYPRQTCLFFSR
jgi:hypothetical protein